MSEASDVRATGRCLCGAVAFEIRGELDDASLCHCSMCRRVHGYAGAYTTCARDALAFTKSEPLTWYASTPQVRRGFCATCGSALFWHHQGHPKIAVTCGSLDAPTNVRITRQIYVASKGDYYELDERLPSEREG